MARKTRRRQAGKVRREFNHLACDLRDNRLTRWIVRRINRRMARDGSRWELRIKRRARGRMAIYVDLTRSYRRACEREALRHHFAALNGADEYRQVLRAQRNHRHLRDAQRDAVGGMQ